MHAQRQRRDDLQLIAQALLTNETLDKEEIQKVLAGTLPKQQVPAAPISAEPAQSSVGEPSKLVEVPSQPDASSSGRSDSGSGPGSPSSPAQDPSSQHAPAPPDSIGSAAAQPSLTAGVLQGLHSLPPPQPLPS